jgi:iron donor protein CyaY
MLSETQFQSLASVTLTRLHDVLDAAYESGALEELELEPGLLTIITETGKTFIVSAHAPSQQIWLASPISGGLHFPWNGTAWVLASGDTLETILTRELATQQVSTAL